jgi:hypothetical protein
MTWKGQAVACFEGRSDRATVRVEAMKLRWEHQNQGDVGKGPVRGRSPLTRAPEPRLRLNWRYLGPTWAVMVFCVTALFLWDGPVKRPLPVVASLAALSVTALLGATAYLDRKRPGVQYRLWVELREPDETPAVRIRSHDTGRVLLEYPSASLAGADLRGVAFVAANLRRADLTRADLRGAVLADAHLDEASLENADLRGANLAGARLCCLSLHHADFRGADLRGVDFGGRGLAMDVFGDPLNGVRLEGALYDDTTRWPAFFNPTEHGCVWCERPEPKGDQHHLPIPSDAASHTASLPVPAQSSLERECSSEPATLSTGEVG